MRLKIIITLIFTVLSGCSPFGGASIIDSVSQIVDDVFFNKISAEITAGSSQVVETNPGVPSQNYKASISIGGQMSQSSFVTNDGYKVYTTSTSQ